MINSIVQLPPGFLQDWILPLCSLKDVVCLDSALLSHRLRPLLHQQLQHTRFSTETVEFTAESARWFANRSLQVTNMHLHRITKEDDMSPLLQLASTIITVRFDDSVTLNSEEIAVFIQSCANAEAVNLSNCFDLRMNGNVLAATANHCPKLRSIDLSNNATTMYVEELDAVISACKNLTEINLDRCQFWVNDAWIQHLAASCPQLLRLHAEICGMCGDEALFALAQHCVHLQQLTVSFWSKLTHAGFRALTAFKELRMLDAIYTRNISSDCVVEVAQSCSKLEDVRLPLCDAHVDRAVISLVQHCPGLKALRLGSSNVTEQSFRALQQCTTLRSLEVVLRSITSAALVDLVQHCSLEYLEVHTSSQAAHEWLTPASSLAASSTAPGLKCIDFTNCDKLSDDYVIPVIQHCHHLQELCLCGCCELTDAVVLAIAAHCPLLRIVDLYRHEVSDETVEMLASSCPHLEVIQLGKCCNISDYAVICISEHCANLRHLDVSHSAYITDAGVAGVVYSCRQLRELNLANCCSITDDVFDVFLQDGACLRKVILTECPEITQGALDGFRAERPSCKIAME